MAEWLVEESVDPRSVARSLVLEGAAQERGATAAKQAPTVAVRLHDVLIHHNKKWLDIFGGADVRLDAIVVQGNVIESGPAAAYVPTTMRFAGIGDGDSLPGDEFGMLLYFGRPRHFLDISIIVSRDRRDTDDLSSLLAREMNSSAMKGDELQRHEGGHDQPSRPGGCCSPGSRRRGRRGGRGHDRRPGLPGGPESDRRNDRDVPRKPARPTPISSVRAVTRPTGPATGRAISRSGMRLFRALTNPQDAVTTSIVALASHTGR